LSENRYGPYGDKNIVSTQTIWYSEKRKNEYEEYKAKQEAGIITVYKKVNGWSLVISTDVDSGLTISAFKTIGKSGNEEAELKFTLKTTKHRVPAFVKTESYSTKIPHGVEFVEADYQKDEMNDLFKEENKYYKREFHASSIRTVDEFLMGLIPNYVALFEDPKLDEYVSKISDETASVEKPFNRSYVNLVK